VIPEAIVSGKITGLVVQKRNKERVNVYIDGEFAFGLAMIEALRLRKGQDLSDEEIERLRALDEIEVAHEAALNFLSYRPRSVAEVRKRLQDKEFSPETIDSVLARLKDTKLLDDESFAQYWVENREQFEPRSARALRFELRRKGVPDSDISTSLESLDEEDAAYRAAKAQARRLQGKDLATFKKRLGDFLLRRGFGYPIIKTVVKRLWEESAPDGDHDPDMPHSFDDMNPGE
jgi:regulatory protein